VSAPHSYGTPRTDDLMHLLAGIELTMPSLLEHARQLERELAEEKETAKNLANAYVAEREVLLRYKAASPTPEHGDAELRKAAIELSDALHAAEEAAFEFPMFVDKAWERLSVAIEASSPATWSR
jgi:hypothetical protein